jgi:cation diffusion facilitator CzcD-associated flavoprotein CzcO
MIIYATGFDAITGSFHRIDWRGVDGRNLKDAWTGGPKTFVGVQVEGFPNMFMVVGPHTALGNIPRSIEYNVEWVTDLIAYMTEHDLTYADPRPESVAAWTDNVRAAGEGLLTNEIDSWMTGINSNVEGKQVRTIARYSGSAPAYRSWCDAVAAGGYKEIDLK